MTLESVAAALGAWPVSEWMRSSVWAYPLVEIGHIVGLAVLVGSIFIIDLRLLGAGRGVSSAELQRFVLPWTLGSLVLAVPSGLLLFLAHAPDLVNNNALRVKLLLMCLAGVNALLFHAASRRPVRRARERAAAIVSITLWVAVITAGRLIAYV